MLNIVLVNPEIPPNTGSIIRQCAATGFQLHLVEPIAFDMSDRRLQRAGLDYHEYATVTRYPDWAALVAVVPDPARIFLFDTCGTRWHDTVAYAAGDFLVFGNEQKGLPQDVISSLPDDQRVRLPMLPDRRSLNLATTVGITSYEAWRQLGFPGGV